MLVSQNVEAREAGVPCDFLKYHLRRLCSWFVTPAIAVDSVTVVTPTDACGTCAFNAF